MTPIERAARADLLPNFDRDLEPPFSPIERAALALMREDYEGNFYEDGTLDDLGQFYWREQGPYYVRSVRAVIAAIREPGEGMVGVGSACGDWPHSRETWQDMIDALLAEGEEEPVDSRDLDRFMNPDDE